MQDNGNNIRQGFFSDDVSLKSLYKNKSQLVQKDDKPDMVYFYSEPLVDYVTSAAGGKKLVTTGFDQLSIDAEYIRLVKILDAT